MFRRLMWKIKDKRFDKRMAKQRYKRGFSDNDCWGMYYWFSDTLPKMIINLRNMKHGAPELPFEEVDKFSKEWVEEKSKEINELKIKEGYDPFDITDSFDRWQLVLTRIAWCLEQASDEIVEIDNEYQEEYNKQVWGDSFFDTKIKFKDWWAAHTEVAEVDKKGKPKSYLLKTNEANKELKEKYWKREEEIANYRNQCKDEAFDLLKKYFYNLWD